MKASRSKNNISTLTFLICMLLINSCNVDLDEITQHKIPTLTDIKKRGKIVALTGYNAYSYFIYKGKTMGFEYELLQRFGKKLGVDVEIKIEKNIGEMFDKLNKGEGDLIAFNLTVTNERRELAKFSEYLNTTKQVLIQRKPQNWRKLTQDQINSKIIVNTLDLEGKTIYARHSSSYLIRLKNLAQESGLNINIIEADDSLSTEDLIQQVAEGKIDFTISDENIAHLNQEYFPNLDISTSISFDQKVAWAVNQKSDSLLIELNNWITEFKKTLDFRVIYERYYVYRNYYKHRRRSIFFLKSGGMISKYDPFIKKYAKELDWDWRLLASIIYQESTFDPNVNSWAGAIGLMQILPETALKVGVENITDPEENIKAGTKYLKWLDNFWAKEIDDAEERIKFVLASYNLGFGHIEDARRLAEKYGVDKNIWFDNTVEFLKKKSNPHYYNDEVVKNGYCRCIETTNYVKEVLKRYEEYVHFTR